MDTLPLHYIICTIHWVKFQTNILSELRVIKGFLWFFIHFNLCKQDIISMFKWQLKELSLCHKHKYSLFATWSYKPLCWHWDYAGIRKSEFETQTHFLYLFGFIKNSQPNPPPPLFKSLATYLFFAPYVLFPINWLLRLRYMNTQTKYC